MINIPSFTKFKELLSKYALKASLALKADEVDILEASRIAKESVRIGHADSQRILAGIAEMGVQMDGKLAKTDALTLEEIQASTDLTGKVASAKSLKDTFATNGIVKLGGFTSEGDDQRLSDNYKNYRYLIVLSSYYDSWLPNYGQILGTPQILDSAFEYIHYWTLNGYDMFRLHDDFYINIAHKSHNYLVVYGIK